MTEIASRGPCFDYYTSESESVTVQPVCHQLATHSAILYFHIGIITSTPHTSLSLSCVFE